MGNAVPRKTKMPQMFPEVKTEAASSSSAAVYHYKPPTRSISTPAQENRSKIVEYIGRRTLYYFFIKYLRQTNRLTMKNQSP